MSKHIEEDLRQADAALAQIFQRGLFVNEVYRRIEEIRQAKV